MTFLFVRKNMLVEYLPLGSLRDAPSPSRSIKSSASQTNGSATRTDKNSRISPCQYSTIKDERSMFAYHSTMTGWSNWLSNLNLNNAIHRLERYFKYSFLSLDFILANSIKYGFAGPQVAVRVHPFLKFMNQFIDCFSNFFYLKRNKTYYCKQEICFGIFQDHYHLVIEI